MRKIVLIFFLIVITEISYYELLVISVKFNMADYKSKTATEIVL